MDRQASIDQRDRPDKTEPTLAAEAIENADPREAIENADASEPTDPTERIEPAEPIERMEPEEPIDRIEPLDPMLKIEPEDPNERGELAGTCIGPLWQQQPARRFLSQDSPSACAPPQATRGAAIEDVHSGRGHV